MNINYFEYNIIEGLIINRQVRSNNIILYNFHENDAVIIENILTELNEDLTQFIFCRLERTKPTIPDRPRPIKIRFIEQSIVKLFYEHK